MVEKLKVFVNEKGKRRILGGHPWVFRSDMEADSETPAGVVRVFDPQKKFLATALYSPPSQIALRMLSKKEETIDEGFWRKRLKIARRLREGLAIPSNAYRWVFGESDGIPSFILDRYDEALVFQILSAGLENQRESLLKAVGEEFQPKLLVERSDVSVRNLEALAQTVQVVQGEASTRLPIFEGELSFEVDLLEGQKTGAFLDQRDNRLRAALWARGKKRALDAFSYQGWFACHLSKGAEQVLAVEQSEAACRQIERNAQLNGIPSVQVLRQNVFDYLKEADQRKERFDLVNLDPPAFVKSRTQMPQALKGYKEINLRALKILEPEGILVTSSCSHHLSEEKFLEILQEAARDARREIQILAVGHQAPDHPILLNFPESKYLKCFFLRAL